MLQPSHCPPSGRITHPPTASKHSAAEDIGSEGRRVLDPRQGTYPQDKEPHQASWDHHQGPLRIGDKGRTLGGTTMNGWSKQWTDKGVYPIRWIKETEGDK